MKQDVPNDSGAGWSDPQHSVSIPDDNAGFTINIEDPDAVAIALSAIPLTYGSGGSLFSGAPALYSPQALLPAYSEWGIPNGYESDNSSIYQSKAVSDDDSFEELKPPSLTDPFSVSSEDSTNPSHMINEFVNPQWQPSEQFIEYGLPNVLGGVSFPQFHPQGPSDTSNAHHHHHLDFHPDSPSLRSQVHYDRAPHEMNQQSASAFAPPSPAGSRSSRSSDYHPTTSTGPDYLNPYALPVNAPSPSGSESGASDVSSTGSTRSRRRGRDQAAITKRRKKPAKFRCQSCEADFTSRARLKTHIANKHDGVTYECTFVGCEKVYQHSTSRDRHFNDIHRSDAASGSKQPDHPRTYSPYSGY